MGSSAMSCYPISNSLKMVNRIDDLYGIDVSTTRHFTTLHDTLCDTQWTDYQLILYEY
jgi:hypothetical protein